MKSEIWDEKKAQKAKTIVQYLIDNVKNVSVFIRLPIRTRFSFLFHPYHSHLTNPTCFYTLLTHALGKTAHVMVEMTVQHKLPDDGTVWSMSDLS